MNLDKNVMQILFVAALVVLLYFLGQYCSNNGTPSPAPAVVEGLEDAPGSVVGESPAGPVSPVSPQEEGVEPSRPLGENEMYMPVGETSSPYGLSGGNVPQDCFPKDQLNPDDLLPGNAATKFAASNPQAGGELKDQNFLEAGHHIGVNTVGQSLRNANRQLRSEPANPQVKVSPWLTTTIEPDTNRRPLEIGGCA